VSIMRSIKQIPVNIASLLKYVNLINNNTNIIKNIVDNNSNLIMNCTDSIKRLENQCEMVARNLSRINNIRNDDIVNNYFLLKQYLNNDGSFNYENYRSIQEKGNIDKINNIWVIEDNIKFLATYIKETIKSPENGICHGTRRGKEQEWFAKYTGAKVIGTEISKTALQFPNTLQMDFHDSLPEWNNYFDFIYSNSFDHSYDPEKCLNVWIDCLKPNGICIIEHSNMHGIEGVNELDPFGADLIVMPYLITRWAKGRFFVREILDAPEKNQVKYLCFIIISKA